MHSLFFNNTECERKIKLFVASRCLIPNFQWRNFSVYRKWKKIDERLTPNKHIKVLSGDTESKENSEQEVIEVFTVNATEHVENVKKTSEEKINNLKALISSLDPTDNSNKLTIGALTAQIAQIEMTRDTSIKILFEWGECQDPMSSTDAMCVSQS